MTYSVKTTDLNTTITVATGEVNTKYGVALVGRNVSGYGQFFVENILWMLENFASSTSPVARGKTALEGQLWYSTGDNTMRVYKDEDGTFVWARLTPLISSSQPSTDVASATQYFNTTDNKMRVFDGSNWKETSYPGTVSSKYSASKGGSNYGTRTRTVYLEDNLGVKRAVLAFVYVNDGTDTGYTENETIMAVFSDYSFTLSNTSLQNTDIDGVSTRDLTAEFNDSDGIGLTIRKGLNFRQAYSETAVPLANVAYWADTANSLLIGGSNVTAANVYHTGSTNIIPSSTDDVDLGNTSNRFNNLYLGSDIVFGDPTSTSNIVHSILPVDGNSHLTLGSNALPVSTLYVEDIVLPVGGNIQGLSVESFGTSTNPVNDVFSSNVIIDNGNNKRIDSTGMRGLDIKDTSGIVIFDASTGTLQNIALANAITDGDGIATFTYDGSAPKTVAVDSTVVRTSGTQTIAGSKTFSAETTHNGGLTDGTMTINGGSITGGVGASFSGTVSGATGTFSGTLTGGTVTDGSFTTTGGVVTAGNISSISNNNYNIGASGNRWNTVYASTVNTSSVTASGEINGASFDTILPTTNNNLNIGASGTKWNTIYATTFNGTATQAQYADLAEIYSSDSEYEAGTIVKIGGDAEVTQTTTHADRDVFGVVSTAPAYLMNSEAEGVPVALAGRCPVKVIGKVKKGERLISSDEPGYAWALGSDNYDARSIIGRSLEDKEDGGMGTVEAVIGIK
jgi:hypothetical protein